MKRVVSFDEIIKNTDYTTDTTDKKIIFWIDVKMALVKEKIQSARK